MQYAFSPTFVQLERSHHSPRLLFKLPFCMRHSGLPSQYALPLLITEVIYIYLYLQEGSTGSPNAFPTSLAVVGSCDRGIAHLSRVDHRSMITISVTFQHRPVVEMQQYLARIWDHPPPRTQYPALQPTDGIRQPAFSCGFCTT